ncbi:hypothetical protein DKM44_02310 [Deinococcus irradiatisoli]|uniref:Uncharacterized protein n=1 Tax=Deinococcus irradiatisoli TaxID=2202254 RepID=A0A2Z3JFF1_9DEIO|nr:hypothetical protein [Deinococcus irradiatisoli]AWN22211.1 hypothetical protein DKM44_02310 [Deinococcus irradiatisoli]
MIALTFIQALKAELQTSFPEYTVQAREPIEGELKASSSERQLWITTEGFDSGEDVADQGQSTEIRVPVFVSIVIQRPRSENATEVALTRRLNVVQACQRAARDFNNQESDALVNFIQEQPLIIEGFLVSVTQLDIQYDLGAEEE